MKPVHGSMHRRDILLSLQPASGLALLPLEDDPAPYQNHDTGFIPCPTFYSPLPSHYSPFTTHDSLSSFPAHIQDGQRIEGPVFQRIHAPVHFLEKFNPQEKEQRMAAVRDNVVHKIDCTRRSFIPGQHRSHGFSGRQDRWRSGWHPAFLFPSQENNPWFCRT